jgi:FtsZ-interacting cell division protein ZipA
VLPGPRPAPQAFEELINTARNLNDRLHGVLQDERGSPLTTARIALLRERVSSESH